MFLTKSVYYDQLCNCVPWQFLLLIADMGTLYFAFHIDAILTLFNGSYTR